jgi:two-component system response regulator AtoC
VSTRVRGSILLVDDEEGILKTLGRALREEGHDVVVTSKPMEAERLLAERAFDVFVVDHRMPDKTGLELIRDLAELPESERPQFILMTAHATIDNAIEAMKLGAFDYLQKPFEVDELLVAVGRALEHHRLRGQHRYLLREQEEQFDHYGIIGGSRVIQEVISTLERVAQARSTVLITGETGTGKELAARAIHARSPESDRPLIRVNCAAIPEALLESELFGHVRGAFTGATSNRRGRFSLADGGTIFLDEIGTLGLPVQAKLLRVLQEREFEPVGSERTEKVDVRVIAATNRDLRAMVGEGRFQEDLYYRLSVIPIQLPPLRDRREDIPPLAAHFVRKHAQRVGREIEGLDDATLDRLRAYDWPGNVRELENTIERAVVLATGPVIDVASVSIIDPPAGRDRGALPSSRLHDNLAWAERESIRRALQQASGVKKDAAQILGISQRALSHYLGKHRIGNG